MAAISARFALCLGEAGSSGLTSSVFFSERLLYGRQTASESSYGQSFLPRLPVHPYSPVFEEPWRPRCGEATHTCRPGAKWLKY
jgi:hypothetical protein